MVRLRRRRCLDRRTLALSAQLGTGSERAKRQSTQSHRREVDLLIASLPEMCGNLHYSDNKYYNWLSVRVFANLSTFLRQNVNFYSFPSLTEP